MKPSARATNEPVGLRGLDRRAAHSLSGNCLAGRVLVFPAERWQRRSYYNIPPRPFDRSRSTAGCSAIGSEIAIFRGAHEFNFPTPARLDHYPCIANIRRILGAD